MSTVFAKPWDYAPRRAGGPRTPPEIVARGTRVTICRGIVVSDVWIVGDEGSEPARGRIAASSPLGCALIGARVGESVEYQSGGRVEEIRILAICAATR